jgi:hypothetical protein
MFSGFRVFTSTTRSRSNSLFRAKPSLVKESLIYDDKIYANHPAKDALSRRAATIRRYSTIR